MTSAPRTLLPFWAMLFAVWAMVMLGAAPASAADRPCTGQDRSSHHDCTACLLCCAAHAGPAILADATPPPPPPGRWVGIAAVPTVLPGAGAPPVTARARGPPGIV